MPHVTVGKENSGDINLYYEDHGAGKPVILIHGWPLSGASWEKQIPALLGAGYRVITYDRRGFGRSSQPNFGYDYDTLATDLQALILNLDLHDATIVGFSMGGGEVARYLGKFGAERIAKAAFLAAIPPFLVKTPENPEGVDKSIFDGIEQAIVADRPAFLKQFLANFYNVDVLGGKLISDPAVQASWNIAVSASPKGTLDCVNSWQIDFRSDLKSITIPTLVVHGNADRILPLEATGTRTASLVKGSNLVVIDGGPHGLNWTHAEQVNQALLAFLQ